MNISATLYLVDSALFNENKAYNIMWVWEKCMKQKEPNVCKSSFDKIVTMTNPAHRTQRKLSKVCGQYHQYHWARKNGTLLKSDVGKEDWIRRSSLHIFAVQSSKLRIYTFHNPLRYFERQLQAKISLLTAGACFLYLGWLKEGNLSSWTKYALGHKDKLWFAANFQSS